MSFASPQFFSLLVLLALIVVWYVKRSQTKRGTLRYSNLGLVKNVQSISSKRRYRHVGFALRIGVLALLVIGLARPQSSHTEDEIITEGVDIVLALDTSSSMLAEDFRPNNRLEAAKLVAADFINGRKNDRIGMVVFAAKSFTQCPLTLDYGVLLTFLEHIESGMIEDGTAIGMAIANATNRLRDSTHGSFAQVLPRGDAIERQGRPDQGEPMRGNDSP